MRFHSKIRVLALAPVALFMLGLAVSLGSLLRTQRNFDHYIATEQAVERGLTEMYAQGLQMGQALRNMAMDPKNQQAGQNLRVAQTAYENAYVATRQSAAGTGFEAPVAGFAALRSTHATAQSRVLALLERGGEAVGVLNAEETPAWRKLRAALLEQKEAATRSAEAAHQQVTQASERAVVITAVIAALAVLFALALNRYMLGTIDRALGGDPAEARDALQRISLGDLSGKIANNGGEDSLMGVMLRTQVALEKLVHAVRNGSVGIATATREIAAGSQDLSNRTESQASALEQTAASMEQLTATVGQNAAGADQANQFAQSASAIAVRGGDTVGRVVATMRGINESSTRIADIISVIDGIAFQTNILALNAAVEAARAGEQGRGFAVVASEVRSLAGRSAEAAREIKQLIQTSVAKVQDGTALVDQAGITMGEVVESIHQVTDKIGAIHRSSDEQALGVAQIGEAIHHMDQTTQQNAALVEQMAAAASSLNGQASDLVQAVAVFKLA